MRNLIDDELTTGAERFSNRENTIRVYLVALYLIIRLQMI